MGLAGGLQPGLETMAHQGVNRDIFQLLARGVANPLADFPVAARPLRGGRALLQPGQCVWAERRLAVRVGAEFQ